MLPTISIWKDKHLTAIQPLDAALSSFLDLNFSQDNDRLDFYNKELLCDLTQIGSNPIDGYSVAARLLYLVKQDAVFNLTRMSDSLIDYGNSLDIVAPLNRLYLTNPARLLYLAKIHLACKAVLSFLSLYQIRTPNLPLIYISEIEFTCGDVNVEGLDKVDNLSRDHLIFARKAILEWVTVMKLDECDLLFPHIESEFGPTPNPIGKGGLKKLSSYLLLCRSGLAERLLKLNHEMNRKAGSA